MKSGGLSFFRLSIPVFVVAFFVSIFAVAFNELVVPAANVAYNNTVYYEIQKNTTPKSQDHIIIKDVDSGNLGRLTYARRFDEATNTMVGVTIEEFDNERLVRVENAEKAVWKNDRWVMYYGTIYDMGAEGNLERSMRFDEQIMPVNKAPKAIAREQKKPEEMTIRELKQQIRILQREYVKAGTYEVELHQRVAIPMASLVFALIGTPLGLSPHRSSSSTGLGFSIVIIFIYYIIMAVSTALGQGGAIPAVLAAWLPNIIGIIAGVYLVRRAS